MSATNRFGNRLFLLLVGLALVAAGGAGLALALPTPIAGQAADVADGVHRTASGWVEEIGAAASLQEQAVVAIAAGVALLVVGVIALVVITTRGGGRSRELLVDRADAGLAGGVEIAASAAESLFLAGVADRVDVVAASASTHVARGTRVVRLRIQPRQGAAVQDIVAAAAGAAARADALLGRTVPVVVELAEGARARLASDTRTASTTAVAAGPSPRTGGAETVGIARGSGEGTPGAAAPVAAASHHQEEGGTR